MNNEDLAKICEYMLSGLSEKEACILSDVDPSILQAKKESNPKVNDIIEKSKIEFKLAHLKEIQHKKSGNNSQWLLEKLRPEEFGNKSQPEVSINIISQIIQSIQHGEEQSRLIPRTRGEFITEEEGDKQLEVGSFLK